MGGARSNRPCRTSQTTSPARFERGSVASAESSIAGMSSGPRHRWGRGRRRQRRPGQRRNTELSLKGAKLRQVNRSDDVDDGELLGLGDEDGEAVGGAAFAPAVDFDELALALLLRRYQPRPPRRGQLLP